MAKKTRFFLINTDIVYKNIEDERVLFNSETGQVTVVNETGRFILDQCNGKLSSDQIIEKVIDCYGDVPVATIKKEVGDFLSGILKRKIVRRVTA